MIKFIDEPAIIDPECKNLGVSTAVTTFSNHIFNEILTLYGARKNMTLPGGVEIPIYEFIVDGVRIAAYKSPVGAPAAVGAMEEVYAAGVKNIIAYGICGALTDVPTRRFIVPTRSYRDEGTSYHYAPPSEFVELKNSDVVAKHLDDCKIGYIKGAAWTTDGFYRETRTRMEHMKKKGCVAVDMESSALQTVSDFRGKSFYTFFMTADSLAGERWEPNYLLDPRATCAESMATSAAVKLAVELESKRR